MTLLKFRALKQVQQLFRFTVNETFKFSCSGVLASSDNFSGGSPKFNFIVRERSPETHRIDWWFTDARLITCQRNRAFWISILANGSRFTSYMRVASPSLPEVLVVVCCQNISDGWHGNLREYVAHLV